MSEANELKALFSALVAYKEPQQILLFGSRAKGTQRADSDIDLCVLYDQLPKRNIEVLQDLYNSTFQIASHPVDLLVYETKAFQTKYRQTGSFESVIKKESQVVYPSRKQSLRPGQLPVFLHAQHVGKSP